MPKTLPISEVKARLSELVAGVYARRVPGASRRFTIDIPPEVADIIRHLAPDLKRGVRPALRALSVNPHEGVPLVRDLEGKRECSVS